MVSPLRMVALFLYIFCFWFETWISRVQSVKTEIGQSFCHVLDGVRDTPNSSFIAIKLLKRWPTCNARYYSTKWFDGAHVCRCMRDLKFMNHIYIGWFYLYMHTRHVLKTFAPSGWNLLESIRCDTIRYDTIWDHTINAWSYITLHVMLVRLYRSLFSYLQFRNIKWK